MRKVADVRVVFAGDPAESSINEDLNLPKRSRIVKLANSDTYDKQAILCPH